MASGTVIYIPPSGGTVQAGPSFLPRGVPQQAGTVPFVSYVQYGGQQPGGSSNPPQQNRPVGALEKFLQAETKTLGAIQILIGLMHIGFGAISLVTTTYPYFIPLTSIGGYPFWGGIFFIVSGSLCVSAAKNPSTYLVRCSVGFNITSAVMAAVGIILYIAEMAINDIAYVFGHQEEWVVSVRIGAGLSIILLLFSILEFCITVPLAHFGCQATCFGSNLPAVVYVPYAATGEGVAPSEGTAAAPPAYTSKAE